MSNYISQPLFALPVKWPFPCQTNSDYGETLSFQDGTEPIDLTEHTFQADVKRSAESIDVLKSFGMAGSASGEGFYITDAANGLLQVLFLWETLEVMFEEVYPDNLGNNLPWPDSEMRLPYDMIVTYPDGLRQAWFRSHFILNKGITDG